MVNGAKRLPDGWEWMTLREVSKEIYRYPTFYGMEHLNAGVPVIRGEHILGNGTISHDWNNYWYVSEEYSSKFPKTIVETGDLIMSVRGKVGKIGIVDEPLRDAQVSPNCIRISTKRDHCAPKFLFYYLKSSSAQIAISDNVNATTIQTIKASSLSTTPVPLPPLPEQERIVNRIEELFSDLEAGVASLERVRAGLRRYKASVLKAAVSGKLVNGKSENGSAELPEGWRIAKVENIAETIGGVTKGRNFRDKKTVKLPYLRVANVQRGRLDLDEMKDIELLDSEIKKYRLHDGDVVLTEGGDWDKLGRSAIWRNQIELCVHQNHIFRARVKDFDILPEWLMYFTNSEVGQDYFKEAAKQTTNLASINLTQLRNCPVPLPPLDEQRRIVAEVERRLSVVGEVESAVEVGLVRAARLRQAVLRSAFEGRL